MSLPRVFRSSATRPGPASAPPCSACGQSLAGGVTFGGFHSACLDRLLRSVGR